MGDNHKDLLGWPLEKGANVVFCLAGTCKGMTVGRISRVLPKTVEVAFEDKRGTRYVFRSPVDVVRV